MLYLSSYLLSPSRAPRFQTVSFPPFSVCFCRRHPQIKLKLKIRFSIKKRIRASPNEAMLLPACLTRRGDHKARRSLPPKMASWSLSPALTACVSTVAPFALFGAYFLGELAYVAAFTPRLPEAPGPTTGVADETKEGEEGSARREVSMVCVGDSVAAGCGLRSNEEACAGAFARGFSRATNRRVRWEVIGRNGYTASRCEQKHVKRIKGRPDVVVLSVGVNNLLHNHSAATFETELKTLIASLRQRCGPMCQIVLLGMPPMSMFVALTPLLRILMGRKASTFNSVMEKVCRGARGCVHADYQDLGTLSLREVKGGDSGESGDVASFFAPDGFHPGPKALEFMAEHFFENLYECSSEDAATEVVGDRPPCRLAFKSRR